MFLNTLSYWTIRYLLHFGEEAGLRKNATAFALDPAKISTAASLARSVLGFRRRRAKRLGSDLFSDPAWDILLILMSESETSNPCTPRMIAELLESHISESTAERWLIVLEGRGLVIKDEGSARGAPAYVLSPNGFEGLNSLIN